MKINAFTMDTRPQCLNETTHDVEHSKAIRQLSGSHIIR